MLRLALTPRWLGFLALVLALAACFVGLSAWQVDRAQHKNDAVVAQDVDTVRAFTDTLDAQVPMPGILSDQRVSLTGEYLPDAQVLVEGRLHEGESGFWVVTMFAPDGAHLGEEAQLAPAEGSAEAEPAAEAQAGAQPQAGAAGPKPIAVPVVRGWVPDAASAEASPAPEGSREMTARLGPVEGAEPAAGLPAGQVRSVSTAQLVNLFDVYSYSGILFPEDFAAAVGSPDSAPMEQVVLERQEGGGFDLQSAIYAVEWIFFAGFALTIWFTLLRDAHRREQAERRAAEGPVEYVVVKQAGEREMTALPAARSESGTR
ncbi:SURF1 family protein [Brevibacterium album]|uniref:SURF1 family protein n=1 Tax=Brevibacterium album TaxID=417948 RepID=UPI0004233C09|nr:SURF1 family protein [Brevibacterium album]